MRPRALFYHGAPKQHRVPGRSLFLLGRGAGRRGFTLLELCTVLCIIVLFLGAMMPAMQSVFREKALRDDAHQLSLMIKTAMLQSADQHVTYELDLTSSTMSLHPAGNGKPDQNDDLENDPNFASQKQNNNPDADAPPSQDIVVNAPIDSANKLLIPDPEKTNAWMELTQAQWLFKPGELCALPRVRITRGDAYLEMSFNALTGNVENETTYFP